jgi:uncharacterized protein YjbI with pentapeptide repeats
MRTKHINQNFSGKDFSRKSLDGYYRDCDFSNCDFRGSEINIVAVRCKFDGSDFTRARIGRLHSPGSTFKDCKFEKGLLHATAHRIMRHFNILHNHEVVAEILRGHVMREIPRGVFKTKCLAYIDTIETRKDLSWAELTRMADDDVILQGIKFFDEYKILQNQAYKFRPELKEMHDRII